MGICIVRSGYGGWIHRQVTCVAVCAGSQNRYSTCSLAFKLRCTVNKAGSCGVVRLSILPSQGSDPGFKSRREHSTINYSMVYSHDVAGVA